jgi:hypothetical protein
MLIARGINMPFKKGFSGNPAGRPKKWIGEARLRILAQGEAEESLAALVRIRDDPKSPPAAVIAASQALLDRGFGKVPVVARDANPMDPAVPTGVIEAPRQCETGEEWQGYADRWVREQGRVEGGEKAAEPPALPASPKAAQVVSVGWSPQERMEAAERLLRGGDGSKRH